MRLTKKDLVFSWTKEDDQAFATLKQAFTTACILMDFDSVKPVVVEINALDYVSAGILAQPNNNKVR